MLSVLVSAFHASSPEELDINFKYGRLDCQAVNDGVGYEDPADFPDPKQGLHHVLEWCLMVFGLDDRACVALMGKIWP